MWKGKRPPTTTSASARATGHIGHSHRPWYSRRRRTGTGRSADTSAGRWLGATRSRFDGCRSKTDALGVTKPKIDPALHQAKKPDWIKVRLPSNPVFFDQGAHCRSSLAQFAKALSAPIDGSVEPRHRHLHDRRRPLCAPATCRDNRQTAWKPMSLSAWRKQSAV